MIDNCLYVILYTVTFLQAYETHFCNDDLGQVDALRNRCELQEFELQKSAKKAQEAMAVAAEESAKSKAAKEVIKSLTAQVVIVLTPFGYTNTAVVSSCLLK